MDGCIHVCVYVDYVMCVCGCIHNYVCACERGVCVWMHTYVCVWMHACVSVDAYMCARVSVNAFVRGGDAYVCCVGADLCMHLST